MCPNSKQLSTTKRQSNSSRLAIWNLDKKLHCSVIGTCLTIKELLQFGNKFGIAKKILNDNYQLHGTFVAIAGTRSPKTRLINKHLNKKYRQTILRFRHAHHTKALSALWQEALSSGDIASAFWALITHPMTSDNLLVQVFGEAHMLSHLSGGSIRVDMLKLTKLQHKVPKLEQKLNVQEQKSQQALAKKEIVIQKLNNQLIALQNTQRQFKFTEERLKKAEQQNRARALHPGSERLSKQLIASQTCADRAEKDAQEWKALASTRSERCQLLEAHLTQLVTEKSTVEQTLKNLLSEHSVDSKNNDDRSGDIDLCNRCILFVGGRNRQCAHFRTLVEQLNGRFLHHDGGLEESPQRLTSLVARSDAVLCPLDCISHDAMNRIKRDCKHQGKPLQFLRQSSLATFTHGLHLVATEQ